jgi:hypothetical protein
MSKKRVRSDRAPRSMPYCKRTWSLAERIAHYSKLDPLSGCHIWQGPLRGGYGHLWHQHRISLAHRLAWELKHGSIPKGMVLRHRCNVGSCVNPDHLVPGTRSENNADIKAAHLRLADARAATARGSVPGARPIRIFYDGVELTGDVMLKVVRPV